MAKVKKKAHKSWTEGKTQEEIDEVIARRKATRKKNMRKGTTVKLQAKAKKIKKAGKKTKVRVTNKTNKKVFVSIDVLEGNRAKQPYYVTVRFKQSMQNYTYLTDIPNIEKDDKLVVKAPGGYEVVTVVDVSANKPTRAVGFAMKWVVDKVDTKAYKLREQLATRKAALKAQIAEKRRSLIENQDIDVLAQYDPEIGELAEELRSLGG